MFGVRFVALPPAAAMTQTSNPWTKAMRVPSGDHAGEVSATVLAVSCVGPVPSALIDQISVSVWPSTSKLFAT